MTRSFNLKRKSGNKKAWFIGNCPLCPFSYNANTKQQGAMIRRLHEKKCKHLGIYTAFDEAKKEYLNELQNKPFKNSNII